MQKLSNKKQVNDMTDEEVSRWICLFEAVNYVSAKAEKIGIDIERDNSWIKPLAFKNYISEMYESVYLNNKLGGDKKVPARTVNEYIFQEHALHS
jgi:hypothetical protein|tara:strand:- start:231 stop:515 length:285 start_codon:yes stop_codon:yes gene_type:complete